MSTAHEPPARTRPPAVRRRTRVRFALTALVSVVLLGACGSAPKRGGPPAAIACARLEAALSDVNGLRITAADELPADGAGHPPHCRVRGHLDERRGAGGTRYAIGFELRLPSPWNGRLLHQPQADASLRRWVTWRCWVATTR